MINTKEPYNIIEGVKILTPLDSKFEDTYLKIRNIENRILSDEQVRSLPYLSQSHSHSKEWLLRSKTAIRFTSYLGNKPNIRDVLDIGCGNGWFTNLIGKSLINSKRIVGADVNLSELAQGRRVFTDKRIDFVYWNLMESNKTLHSSFDLIVLNASLQYFSSIKTLINRLKEVLNDKGEIHILDSPIYKERELSSARERSITYYRQLGHPKMADFYYHHSIAKLNDFELMYKPKPNLLNKVLGTTNSPFPWLRYVHKKSKINIE